MKKKKSVEQQVHELGQRVDNQIPVARFILHVYMDQLVKAEALRRLAAALVMPVKSARTKTYAVDAEKFYALEAYLSDLVSFHNAKKKMPKAARALLAKKSKRTKGK